MASTFSTCPLSITSCNLKRLNPEKPNNVMAFGSYVIKSLSGTTNVSVSAEPSSIVRRSANYKPSPYDNNFLQSMKSNYTGEAISAQAAVLKEEVRSKFESVVEQLDQLELIDHLQKLGLAYHFHEEIDLTLKKIHNNDEHTGNQRVEMDLHATSLKFRLLRQHGHFISPEGFKRCIENCRLSECSDPEDVKGVLSLYEASYFAVEGESLMEEAHCLTSKLLRERVEDIIDMDLKMQVRHALQLPLQWRIPSFDARWYIDLYQRSTDMIPAVLDFAKLDFNIRQTLYQEELKDLSRWWSRLGMRERLPFARDRLVASYLWSLGVSSEPKDRYCREQLAKIIELIGVYDDVYDVYGTLDELEIFTDVTERWDIDAMKELPDYMKMCFLSIYNFVNETSYDILKDHNIDVLTYQRKWWNELFRRYIVEARWYHSGYKPTLEEYLKNGYVSIACPIVTLYAYICTVVVNKKNDIEYIQELPDIVRLAGEIFRLTDDYGTSSSEVKRGDVPSSIQCYMLDTGVTEEIARKHIMDLIRKKWTQINKLRFSEDTNNPLSWSFIDIMMNLIRAGHCLYNSGDDGYGDEQYLTNGTLFSLIVKPIPL